MKFGKVDNPGDMDFSLPLDHADTILSLAKGDRDKFDVRVGCAKWNRQDLKNFYPRGTKDELVYYSAQFNSIEFNAFFYRIFSPNQVKAWSEKTGEDFKFYPKIPQVISQFKRLRNIDVELNDYIESISSFGAKLGMCFLQMHPTFAPKSIDSLSDFLDLWPKDRELSVEVRHPDWYSDERANADLSSLLSKHDVTHTLADVAGRRDLVHMQLTNPKCFIRFTGANHSSDYKRLDDWVVRLKQWKDAGIDQINFFIHQNVELESPLLAKHFIEKLNRDLGTNLHVPQSGGLF